MRAATLARILAVIVSIASGLYITARVVDEFMVLLPVADFARVVAFAMAGLILIYCVTTVTTYFVVYRSRVNSGQEASLPLHVWLAACAQMILVTAGCAEMGVRFGEPPTWRLPTYTLAFAVGTFSLNSLKRSQAAAQKRSD